MTLPCRFSLLPPSRPAPPPSPSSSRRCARSGTSHRPRNTSEPKSPLEARGVPSLFRCSELSRPCRRHTRRRVPSCSPSLTGPLKLPIGKEKRNLPRCRRSSSASSRVLFRPSNVPLGSLFLSHSKVNLSRDVGCWVQPGNFFFLFFLLLCRSLKADNGLVFVPFYNNSKRMK